MDTSDAIPCDKVINEKQEAPESATCVEKIQEASSSSPSKQSVKSDDDQKRKQADNERSTVDDDDEDAAELLEKLQTLKGDRIGETMYSERFVLSTILKLSQRDDKLLEDDEEFERDLCNLWDMTIEPDVVRFLLQQDVIELFLALATRSKDYRLIEILFGIVGNMCCVEEMHSFMYQKSDLLLNLCEFFEVPDAPVLAQLMRTLTTLFDRSDDDQYRWFDVMKKVDNLTETFSLILATSTNRVLLEHTVETINAMINRFTESEVDYAQLKEFYGLFGKGCLPVGLFEAFRQLYPPRSVDTHTSDDDDGFDEGTLTLKDLKTMRRFLEIHEHFIVNANELYEPHVEDVVQCIHRVLVAFASENVLLPLTKNHVTMFVSINNIYSGIMYHFHCDSFVCMVRVYDMLMRTVETNATEAQESATSENGVPPERAENPMQPDGTTEDDEEEFDAQTASAELLEAIFYLVGPIDEQIIRGAIRQSDLKPDTIAQLCQGMREAMDGDPLLYQTCTKLMNGVAVAEAIPEQLQTNGHANVLPNGSTSTTTE